MIEVDDADIKFLAEELEAAFRLRELGQDVLALLTADKVCWSPEARQLISYITPICEAYLRGRGFPPFDPSNITAISTQRQMYLIQSIFMVVLGDKDAFPNIMKYLSKGRLDAGIASELLRPPDPLEG